jgi:hypothetical protein
VKLAFLSPATCAEGTTTSPLRRALLDTVSDTFDRKERLSEAEDDIERLVRDVSLEGIVEVRGNVDSLAVEAGEELLRLSPRRAFLFTDEDPVAVVERIRAAGVLAYDATGAYAGMAIADERIFRRLTDLDLELIPTAGPFAHVTALFRRGADGWFHVYVHQELGHYAAEAVLDAIAGLRSET